MSSHIRDINLWESGALKIQWVLDHMPLLAGIAKDFIDTKPFAGLKIALSVHMEAKTARLCLCLAAGGAEMYATGCNPLSTQDDVAAALVHAGLNVFAVHGATMDEYEEDLRRVLEVGPNIIIDDGGDLVTLMHKEFRELIPNVIGGCEETTTGILRLKAMDRAGTLKFPMMLVNDADCKHLFDNRYGTGQSVWNGINRTTNLIVAGKDVVVAGYGLCGKGIAMRAKGLGARVIVTEVDPVKALEASMDGFRVMQMFDAAPIGDLFITATGCKDVITARELERMKDGAICCNAGHFDVEVDVAWLRANAFRRSEARQNIEAFTFKSGRTVYVLGEGRLVNLAAGDGHPAEIMDMSFAIQALSARWLLEHRDSLPALLNNVPAEIDREVAFRKLESERITIDTLTPEQHRYIYGE